MPRRSPTTIHHVTRVSDGAHYADLGLLGGFVRRSPSSCSKSFEGPDLIGGVSAEPIHADDHDFVAGRRSWLRATANERMGGTGQ
jgi:hypothetical protein